MKTHNLIKRLLLVAVFTLIAVPASMAIAKEDVHAASYPSIYPENYEMEACAGETVDIKYSYFPAFKNEKIEVKIYSEDGKKVAESSKSFSGEYTTIIDYTVQWDTDDCEPGEYTAEVTNRFYSMFEWHEAPSKTYHTITLKKHNNGTAVVTKKATAKANGTLKYTCKRCGKVSYSTIYKASNVKLSLTKVTYNGKQRNPVVTVKDSKGNKIGTANYTVTKPKGRTNVGKYTYKVTFKNRYQGTKSLYLTIKPKAPTLNKPTSTKNSFTAKWSKVSKQATGYELMYATNQAFTQNKKVVTIKNYNTVSKKITNLKGKKYYVKVRTYKNVNGTKYYSNWSGWRSVKVNVAPPSYADGVVTKGEANALQCAKDYLKYVGGFSREGLIGQLEYEGFTHNQAIYAVNNCGANWKKQCVQCAQDYLDYVGGFSYSGLVDQLEYEGFTKAQIDYAMSVVW